MYDATRPGFSREYQGRVTLARFRVPLYTALTLASVQDVDAHFFFRGYVFFVPKQVWEDSVRGVYYWDGGDFARVLCELGCWVYGFRAVVRKG